MKTTKTTTPDAARARTMRAVKSKNTTPEMCVRRLLHRLGYRFRLHRNDLPGKPDLAFPARRKVVFVHGCWWHGHSCQRGDRIPKTNRQYWLAKIDRNRRRDREVHEALEAEHWQVKVIWECELKDEEVLRRALVEFLA